MIAVHLLISFPAYKRSFLHRTKHYFHSRFICYARTEVTITDLSRHDGIIAFKEREAKIVNSEHFHLHIVDLEKFESSFQNLQYTIRLLEGKNTTKQITQLLDIRVKRLSDNYFRLKPIKRPKRGLMNPLGTIIKSLTGNLDDNDLQLIRQAIDESKSKTNILIDENNRQIKINEHFETKINDLIKHINEQQIDILRKISRFSNNVNMQNQINVKEIIHDLLFNIELLDSQLKDIFEVVQLSRIGVLSKGILNNREIKFILDRLEEQNILINSTDQIYEYLNIETHHENSKIIIVIKIPIFMSGHFEYIKFVTLPTNQKVILTQFNIAISSKSMTFGIKHPCEIIEQYRICKIQELTNITGDGCIENALRGINASCPYIQQKDEMDIKLIDGRTLLIRNAIQPVHLNSSCNIQARQITGTLLISYHNCGITINGVKYEDEKTTDTHEITIIPTIGVNFKATTIFDEPDLQQVNLLRIENRNHINKLKKDHTVLQYTTTGTLSLFAVSIMGLIIWNLRRNSKSSPEVNVQNRTDLVLASLSTTPSNQCSEIRDESSLGKEQLFNESTSSPRPANLAGKQPAKFLFFPKD